MKKIIAILLTLATLILSVACSGGNTQNDQSDSLNVEQGIIHPCDYSYEIAEKTDILYETDGARSSKCLRYPVISGIEDALIQDEINKTFIEVAENQFVHLVPDIEIYEMEGTMFNYEVTKVEMTYLSNTYASVRSTVSFMSAMDPSPKEAVYTQNVSLINGDIIEEDEIFADFTSIAGKFIAGEFTQIYGAENLLENTSYEDMILQYNSDYASFPEVCFTSDKFIINIDLISALGTSAGFEIALSEVDEFLNFNPTK